MTLLFKERIPKNREAFAAKVIDISSKLGLRSPDDLMAVMYSESRLDSTIENKAFPFKDGYATGLIQFTPKTAIGLGTTTAALKAMSNVKQLDYVYNYYTQSIFKNKKFNDYSDLYLATFFPVAMGKPDSFVLETKDISRSAVAKNNPIFDLNKDNKITVGEVRKAFLERFDKMKGGKEAVLALARVYKTPMIVSFLAFGLGIYLVKKYGQIKIV